MRTENYRQIEAPVKLLLEFEHLTVGELSNVLRQYQALLRVAWRDTGRAQAIRTPPVRLLTVSTSTDHSFDLISEFAIPALHFSTSLFGPVISWPSFANSTFQYVIAAWSRLARNPEARRSGQVFIKGVGGTELHVPVSALQETNTARSIENLWAIAHRGRISVTLELPDGDVGATYNPDTPVT